MGPAANPPIHYQQRRPNIMTEWNLFADVADITAWLDESNPAGPHVRA